VKVVIDTNVFVSSFINPSGPRRAIIDLWKAGRITLCICAEILAEYIDVLGRVRVPPAAMKDLLELFRSRRHIEFTVIGGHL
jgi:putative PIN family toxin of toxin-antitoxin system